MGVLVPYSRHVGIRADPADRTLIRGATLVDGTGAPPREADVAIAGDTIAAVEPPGSLNSSGAELVDGRGHVVAPGLIDIMSHSLWPLMIDGRSLSKVVQGVTTEVMGEGWTPAPFGGRVAEIEPPIPGIPEEWRARIRGWTRFGQWLEAVEEAGVSPNVASFLGGGTVREYACGLAMGVAQRDEREVMRRVTEQAMRDGSMGVAYALIYPPDAYAATDEIIEVARTAAASGGMYICHMRSESQRLLEAIDETIEIARASGARSEIYHLKASGGPANWHRMGPAVERIEAAREEGLPPIDGRLASRFTRTVATGKTLGAGRGPPLERATRSAPRQAREETRMAPGSSPGPWRSSCAGRPRWTIRGRRTGRIRSACGSPSTGSTSAGTSPRSQRCAGRTGWTSCSTC